MPDSSTKTLTTLLHRRQTAVVAVCIDPRRFAPVGDVVEIVEDVEPVEDTVEEWERYEPVPDDEYLGQRRVRIWLSGK